MSTDSVCLNISAAFICVGTFWGLDGWMDRFFQQTVHALKYQAMDVLVTSVTVKVVTKQR